MTKSSDLFRTSIRGYNKGQVENHICNIKLEQDNEIGEIGQEINILLTKNEELSVEIENIKKELAESNKSEGYMNFLLEYSGNLENLMCSGAKSEIKELKEQCSEKEMSIENEIQSLNNSLKNIQCNFDILLKTVAVKNNFPETVKGFKVIQYKGRNSKKMLQNDTEKEIKKMAVNENELLDPKDYDSIRNMHILGKYAGDDLISKTGEIIVSKDALITEEVVQVAEDAGKLSELIINMTIPRV